MLLGATFSTAVDMTVDDLTLDSGGMPPPSTDPPTRTVVYGYDGLTRLSSAVESGSSTNSFSYGYDLAGNRTRVTTNGITVTSSYDAADQLTGAGVTYDAAGNQTSDGSTTATFDALGRLTQRGSTNFSYSGDGVLVSQTTSGATTRYTQDLAAPLPQILQYLAGGVLTSYTYGVDRLGGVNATARGWQHLDALGSMRRSVDDAGSVTRTQSYDPWGTPQGGTLPGVFGFTGELQNASSGVLHLRARWYTTGQGRFASVDPFPGMAEQPYSQHPYAYALSNPVRFTDPSGKCVFTGIDTLLCAGVVLTIWEAIAIIVAAGVATYAIYDTCITQGYCDQLAIDLERALQERQATANSTSTYARDPTGLPSHPGAGAACAANIGLTNEGATQAIQAAEADLVRAEGLPRSDITILYRGTSLKSVYQPRNPLWTTPWIFAATLYSDTNAAIDRSSPVIAVYSIPTTLLQAMVTSGTVRTRFAGIRGSEYGFTAAAQPSLFGPIVVPVPPKYPGY